MHIHMIHQHSLSTSWIIIPLLQFRVFHIALMVDAQPRLSTGCIIGLRTPKGDAAESQISALPGPYRHQPGNPQPAVSIPDNYKVLFAQLGESISPQDARLLTNFPSAATYEYCTTSILSKDGPDS